MLKFQKIKFEDVKTCDFGEEVTIRVNDESIKHYRKKHSLYGRIEEMKLPKEEEGPFYVAAGLMAVCTDPETDNFIFHDEQLSDFTNLISGDLFEKLSGASIRVNAVLERKLNETIEEKKREQEKTLSTKKKNT